MLMNASKDISFACSREPQHISVQAIIVVVIIAAVIARQFRMRWEDIVAFIIGPSMVFILIRVANDTFKNDVLPPPSTVPIEQVTTQAHLEPSPSWMVPVAIILIALGLVALVAASRFGFLSNMPLSTGHPRQDRNHTNSTLYFTTAVKLGAATAAADQSVLPNEQRALKRVFNLTSQDFPQANAVYQQQLANPEPLSVILRPFLKAYGRGSAVAETLVFGMTCVAMADGQMSASELGLIRMAADALGIQPQHTVRILMSAGYASAGAGAHQRSTNNGHFHRETSFQQKPQSERDKHLATLGLGADANAASIRKAWRTLASRYHPDKLVSQNLPPAEMEKAETMMQAINVAYDWLKADG